MRLLFALALAFCLSPLALRADFEDLGMGARALGMGDAFTGLADDGRAVYYNPAGLARQSRAEVAADYAKLHAGLDDRSSLSLAYLSYVQPLSRRKEPPRALRVEGRALAAGGEGVPAAARGTLGAALRVFSLAGTYREESLHLSYGRAAGRRFAWGATLKALQERYEQDAYTRADPVFGHGADGSVRAFSADAGLLWTLHPRFSWGAAALDVNRPDLALKGAERLPMTVRTGFGYRDARAAAALDVRVRDGAVRAGLGGERWFGRRTVAARFGLGLGEDDYFNASAGFSFDASVFQVDYGFLFPLTGVSGTAGTHRVAFVHRFGRDETERDDYEALREERDELRKRLSEVDQENERLEATLVNVVRDVEAGPGGASVQPAAAPPAGLPAPAPALRKHVVREGETWRSLAVRYYGDPEKWTEIYRVNKGKVRGMPSPGDVLVVP